MTTAEKRAQLEAAGQPWPDCDCHGEPMRWQADQGLSKGGWFACREVRRQWQLKRRAEFRSADSCYDCGEPVATETLCRSCADRRADFMATPKQRIHTRAAQYRAKAKERAAEGFQPTEAGQAAIEHLLRKPGS